MWELTDQVSQASTPAGRRPTKGLILRWAQTGFALDQLTVTGRGVAAPLCLGLLLCEMGVTCSMSVRTEQAAVLGSSETLMQLKVWH